MKFTTATIMLGLTLCTGCTKQPKRPTLHVVSYDSCDRTQLIGVIGKMKYGLNLEVSKETAMTVACPNPGLGLKDIGKDFPAVADLDRGVITIDLPVYGEPTLEAWTKGESRGQQTGIKQVRFVIDHMQEEPTK